MFHSPSRSRPGPLQSGGSGWPGEVRWNVWAAWLRTSGLNTTLSIPLRPKSETRAAMPFTWMALYAKSRLWHGFYLELNHQVTGKHDVHVHNDLLPAGVLVVHLDTCDPRGDLGMVGWDGCWCSTCPKNTRSLLNLKGLEPLKILYPLKETHVNSSSHLLILLESQVESLIHQWLDGLEKHVPHIHVDIGP